MRLLVTRPEPEAGETAAQLAALGHDVLVDPMLTIEFMPTPVIDVSPQALVFTSRNAVKAVARWPQAKDWRARPAFAVGAETAQHARLAGFTDTRVGDADAVALAGLVTRSLDPNAGPILYPAARDRSADLEAMLAAAGFAIIAVEAYRATAAGGFRPDVLTGLQRGAFDGVLFFSTRSAQTFVRLLDAAHLTSALAGTVIYVMSERVAGPLRSVQNRGIIVAQSPDLNAMLAAVGPQEPDA